MTRTSSRFDVVIVGCGPVGSYLAWKTAACGRSVCAVDPIPRSRQGRRIGIFHFEEEAFRRMGIPMPPAEEIVCAYREVTLRPPLGVRPIVVEGVVNIALRLPLFLERIQGYAREAGAELRFGRRFLSLDLDERGRPRGVRIARPGGAEAEDLEASIVVDATGLACAVRSGLPPGSLLDTEPVREEDRLSVYMEYWRNVRGRHPPGLTSFPEYNGWWAPYEGDKAIVGVGSVGDAAEARAVHREFSRKHFDLPHEVDRAVAGEIPYRKPLDSMVGDGLLVVGDAALQNKPFNGEGISSAYAACGIAAEVIDKALESGDPSAASLWEYNVRYFRGQGSRFAAITAFAPILMSFTAAEQARLFESGLFDPDGMRSLFVDHAPAPVGARKIARSGANLARRPALLGKVAVGVANAALVSALYRMYPASPAGLPLWRTLVAAAWRRCGTVRRGSVGRGPPR